MRLKELREERNLRQIDVATAIRTSQTNIGRWENGVNEPSASFAVKLADFFGVSVDFLLERVDEFNVPLSGNVPQYTAEEQKLIMDYRGLSQPLKEMLRDLIDTWQGKETKQRRKRE